MLESRQTLKKHVLLENTYTKLAYAFRIMSTVCTVMQPSQKKINANAILLDARNTFFVYAIVQRN